MKKFPGLLMVVLAGVFAVLSAFSPKVSQASKTVKADQTTNLWPGQEYAWDDVTGTWGGVGATETVMCRGWFPTMPCKGIEGMNGVVVLVALGGPAYVVPK